MRINTFTCTNFLPLIPTEKELLKPKSELKRADENSKMDPVAMICDLCGQTLDTLSGKNDRPDHINFRSLLWRAMQKFPEKCEPKSRLIAPLLMKFLK